MACEEKNNFGNMLNQLVSFIQPDGPDGEEPLHLYFVSDAAHHIFRYIKESYVGDTQLVIHPVVSIETLADPSSPFNHQNDSFTGLASNPKNNITCCTWPDNSITMILCNASVACGGTPWTLTTKAR